MSMIGTSGLVTVLLVLLLYVMFLDTYLRRELPAECDDGTTTGSEDQEQCTNNLISSSTVPCAKCQKQGD